MSKPNYMMRDSDGTPVKRGEYLYKQLNVRLFGNERRRLDLVLDHCPPRYLSRFVRQAIRIHCRRLARQLNIDLTK